MQNFNAKFKTDPFQRCYIFSLDTISFIDQLPNKRSSWVIGDQLLRSATSIGANMIEGRAASTCLELKKFNEIALKSANETRYWLLLLRDAKLMLTQEEAITKLLCELEELTRMIASGIIKLKQKM